MAVWIGEVPGVDPERAQVRGGSEAGAGGLGLPQQFIHLRLRSGRYPHAELGGTGRVGPQAGVLGQVGALVPGRSTA
jgi:hypothetical protein